MSISLPSGRVSGWNRPLELSECGCVWNLEERDVYLSFFLFGDQYEDTNTGILIRGYCAFESAIGRNLGTFYPSWHGHSIGSLRAVKN